MKGGDVIIPKDEPLLQQNKIRQTTVSVTDPRADVSLITLSERTGSSYFDAYASGSHIPDLCINSPGKHVLHDLALAIAAAKRLMIPNEAISKAIGSIDKDLFRQKNHVINGYKIYDDSYSSSPEALYAVIDTLLLSGLPIIAVLSDMLELGKKADELHRAAGFYAAKRGVRRLYLIGQYAEHFASGAIAGGMKKENIHINNKTNDLTSTVDLLKREYRGEIILIKGSHELHLGRIVDLLKENDYA